MNAVHLVRRPGALAAGLSVALALLASHGLAAWLAYGAGQDREIARSAPEKDRAAVAVSAALVAARDEERRRFAGVQEIADAARKDLAAARADADRARATATRLRNAAADYEARHRAAPSDPAAAAGGPPTAGPGLVLSDVLGSADGRAGELAEALDRSRAAGLACERAYDALTRPL